MERHVHHFKDGETLSSGKYVGSFLKLAFKCWWFIKIEKIISRRGMDGAGSGRDGKR